MATGTLRAVDYSFSRIDHAVARSRGVQGAMRYLYASGKGLTPSEIALFRSSGLSLGLNYEAGAGDFIGTAAGRGHATIAEAFAVRLGLGGNVIIFSADWPVTPAQYKAVGDALQGAMDVKGRGRVGIYGHAGVIDYCAARFGTAAYYWGCYAWSGGRVSAHTDLYQYLNGQAFAGGTVDFNDIRGRTFWAVSGGRNTATAALTDLAPDVPEDDMAAVPQDQWNSVMAAVGRIDNTVDVSYPLTIYTVKGSPDGALYGAQPGRFWLMPSGYAELCQARKLTGGIITLENGDELRFVKVVWLGAALPQNPVDKDGTFAAITAKAAVTLSDADAAKIAAAVGGKQVDPAAIAAALVPLLIPHMQPGATANDIARAVVSGLAAALTPATT